MKVLLAPNAYKGSLTASAVAEAMAQGIHSAIPRAQVIKLPIADGGDGTLDILIKLTRGKILTQSISAPIGTHKMKARWGLLGPAIRRFQRTALIEIAEAAGLRRVPLRYRNPPSIPTRMCRNEVPLYTHTYGVGELIQAALDRKVKRVIVGLGGSATVEGGTGLARCLGARFLDKYGKDIELGGAGLRQLARIDMDRLDPRIKRTEFIAACDVITPLVGPHGAARVFAPQKGADKSATRILADNLEHLARIIRQSNTVV